jgi:hypothetical protein
LKQKIVNGIPLTVKDIAWEEPDMNSPFIKIVDTDSELLAVIEQNAEQDTYQYCCVFN